MLRDVNSRGISYRGQFGILLGLTGAGLIMSILVSGMIWMMMTGLPFPKNSSDILQAKYYSVDMMIQAVSTLFIFFIPAFLFAYMCYHHPNKFLGFNLRFNYKQILLVILIMFSSLFIMEELEQINKILPLPGSWLKYFNKIDAERKAQEIVMLPLPLLLSKYIYSLVVVAFLPAVFEEIFFRAGMQNILTRWTRQPWTSIIITSIIFSAIHFSYDGFLVRVALGILLGIVFYYSGSLWLNILFHFLFNGIQLTALYFSDTKKMLPKENMDTGLPWWGGILALSLVIYLVIQFIKISKAQQSIYPPDDIEEGEEDWLKSSNN